MTVLTDKNVTANRNLLYTIWELLMGLIGFTGWQPMWMYFVYHGIDMFKIRSESRKKRCWAWRVLMDEGIVTLSRCIIKPWLKVFEAVVVAGCSAVAFVTLIYAFPNCHPISGFNETSGAPNLTSGCRGHVTIHRRSPDSPVVYNSGCADVTSNGTSPGEHDHEMYGLHGNHGFVFQVHISVH